MITSRGSAQRGYHRTELFYGRGGVRPGHDFHTRRADFAEAAENVRDRPMSAFDPRQVAPTAAIPDPPVHGRSLSPRFDFCRR